MAEVADHSKRVALVIGNAAYAHAGWLRNPKNDAVDMTRALSRFGFTICGGETNGLNLAHGSLSERIRDFSRLIREREASTCLFFYAGHGMQVNGVNYLVPTDAKLSHEEDVKDELIALDDVLSRMQHPTRVSLVFLDACRDNPLAKNLARAMGFADDRAAGIGQGLAEPKEKKAGTLIAFATQPDHIAYDGQGNNGYFTEAIKAQLEKDPALDIELFLRAVRVNVSKQTEKKSRGPQVPWVNSGLLTPFSFSAPALDQPEKPILPALDPLNPEHEYGRTQRIGPIRTRLKDF